MIAPADTWPASPFRSNGPCRWPLIPAYHWFSVGSGGGPAAGGAAGAIDAAARCPIAMPSPTPSPSPAPPGLLAAASIALAAWNFVYWSRLPTMPIWVRRSSAASTSGGTEMFSMMNLGISMPTLARSSDSAPASRSPMVSWCAARSSIGTCAVASALPSRLTIIWRRYSSTSSVRNCGSVPTSSRSSLAASTTRAAYAPKARSRTMPNSGSRTITGLGVPHFMSVNSRVLTK